jgi:hypothetical protein
MLRAQKLRAASVYLHFYSSNCLEICQGVAVDSLGVGEIEIECKNTPDRQEHRQEAPKRSLTTLASFPRFLARRLRQRGR